MKYRFDAVMFDFDGTFADTGRGIGKCADYAAAAFNLPPLSENERRAFVGPPLYDSFKKLFHLEKDEDVYFAISKYRELYVKEGMYDFDLYDGIIELIHSLNEAGIKTVIASSKPSKFIVKILDYLNIGDCIDLVSCPCDDNVKKTKFDLISEAVEKLGIDKSRALMVGDRYLDIEGAKLAGVFSAGAAYGYGGRAELEAAGADYIAEDVIALKKYVFSPEYK